VRRFLGWSGSFVVALAAHIGAVAVAVDWASHVPPRDADLNPPAIMVDLAPLPAASEPTVVQAPPGPALEDVIPEPEEPPPVTFPPMAKATVSVQRPPVAARRAGAPAERKHERKPPSERSAPPIASPGEAATAPAAEPTPLPDSQALLSWKSALLRHLERNKRYPPEAQRARQEGVTYVRFTMARDGRVLAASIERGSTIECLDREGLDLLRRADPLPPLPADQPGEALLLVVPVQFSLRK